MQGVRTKESRDGKYLSDSGENYQGKRKNGKQMKRRGGSYTKT